MPDGSVVSRIVACEPTAFTVIDVGITDIGLIGAEIVHSLNESDLGIIDLGMIGSQDNNL